MNFKNLNCEAIIKGIENIAMNDLQISSIFLKSNSKSLSHCLAFKMKKKKKKKKKIFLYRGFDDKKTDKK